MECRSRCTLAPREPETVRFAQRFDAETCIPSIVSKFIVVDTVTTRVWRHATYEHQ